MASQRDRALVLRRTPFGESSLVVHALTPTFGRVHFVAKGAYRRTSRYFCVLDLAHTLELGWAQRNERELQVLASGALLVRRRRLVADPRAWSVASTLLELCDLATRPGQDVGSLFAALEQALDRLEAGHAPALAHARFLSEYLAELGLTPALLGCAACGGAAPARQAGGARAAFSAGAGGRLCERCGQEARRSGRRVGTLPVVALEAAAGLARADPGDLQLAGSPELVERVIDLLGRFLDYHLEVRPKGHRTFLATPNRNAP